jgi:hypothetical protein
VNSLRRFALFAALVSAAVVAAAAPALAFFSDRQPAAPEAIEKLDLRLQKLAGRAVPIPLEMAERTIAPATRGNRVHVYARLTVADESALRRLAAAGLEITARYDGLVSGLVHPSRLADLAAEGCVTTVAPFQPALRNIAEPPSGSARMEMPSVGSVAGQGIAALRADVVRDSRGLTGEGVKVGVISNSFAFFSAANSTRSFPLQGIPAPYVPTDIDGDGRPEIVGTDSQLSGDLPEVVELLEESEPYIVGGMDITELAFDDEGRALAEVVHDIAPGAEIAYHTGTRGVPDMAQGMIDLALAGCRVIVDDQLYPGEPIYQDGELAQAVDRVTLEHDVVYVVATGNTGAHAVEAAYRDVDPAASDTAPTSGDFEMPEGHDLHDFGLMLTSAASRNGALSPYLEITLVPSAFVQILLYWENPFSGRLGEGATTDYDFFVLDAPALDITNLVDGGANRQGTPGSPFGDPYESTGSISNSTGAPVTYYVTVNLKAGPPVPFKLIFVTNPRLAVAVQGHVPREFSTMQFGHQMSRGALSTAAVSWFEATSGGTAIGSPHVVDPTYYTSKGGTIRVLFSPSGERLADVELRVKPDVASVDGVNTSFFEGSGGDYVFDDDALPNFLGTSCASPHLAGIVALMREATPRLSAKRIADLVRSSATDVFDAGRDDWTGHGLVYADDAVTAALESGRSDGGGGCALRPDGAGDPFIALLAAFAVLLLVARRARRPDFGATSPR